MAGNQYDAFAEDYEWILSDATLTGESHFENLRPLLETLAPGSHVIDCACGTGIL